MLAIPAYFYLFQNTQDDMDQRGEAEHRIEDLNKIHADESGNLKHKYDQDTNRLIYALIAQCSADADCDAEKLKKALASPEAP